MKSEPKPIDNGGPAFPCPVGHIECEHLAGMSLRAHFAGLAMQSAIMRLSSNELLTFKSGPQMRDTIANDAVMMADAMIALLKTK